MESKRYILDIYCEIDAEDIGQELELFDGDIWCPETGKRFKGTFLIKTLEELETSEEEIVSERQL